MRLPQFHHRQIAGAGGAGVFLQALIAAMDTPPDATRQGHIGNLISSLRSAGVWSKADLIYVLAAHDAQAAGLNWKDPAFAELTATNAPTFTADEGYTGNGTNAFLDAGVALAGLTNYTLNSASAFVWTITATAGTGRDLGTASSLNASILGAAASNNMTMRGNQGLNSSGLAGANGFLDMYGWVRRDAADLHIFHGGALVATTAQASSAVPAGNVTLLRASTGYSPRQIAFALVGGALSNGEVAALYAAVETYMEAIGTLPL